MIQGVLPTAVTVSDMQQSLAFYGGLLGFSVSAELPPETERARWDAYHRQVCGIPDSQIKVVYLVAPDGKTYLELVEYLRPKLAVPARRGLAEPGTAMIALSVEDSATAVAALRDAGVDVLSDPVPYTTDDGVSSYTTYFYDPDGNALCLFEVLGE